MSSTFLTQIQMQYQQALQNQIEVWLYVCDGTVSNEYNRKKAISENTYQITR